MLLFFSNDWWSPIFTHRGHVSSIQVRDYVMTEEEVIALGGPRAVGIPGGVACDPCDMDCNGVVDAFDIEPFLDLLFSPKPMPCNSCTGDVDDNGVVDAFDIEPFLNCLFP